MNVTALRSITRSLPPTPPSLSAAFSTYASIAGAVQASMSPAIATTW